MWLHRTGLRLLPTFQVAQLGLRLSQHHSRDPRYLRLVARMASTASKVDNRWRCDCQRLNGPTAEFCGQCGLHWQYVGWQTYEKPQREKSRPRSRKPRTGKGKGNGKAKDGKSKDKDKDGGKNTENQNPVTPRTVRTTELSSPDFKKPMVTDPKAESRCLRALVHKLRF